MHRFSCCAKVFPCDKYVLPTCHQYPSYVLMKPRCHDAETDHPNEHANRMIWYVSFNSIITSTFHPANRYSGFCSREQIYRPENCGICKSVLVGKAGSGFWEGGKGTRNRALMSRKGMASSLVALFFASLAMLIWVQIRGNISVVEERFLVDRARRRSRGQVILHVPSGADFGHIICCIIASASLTRMNRKISYMSMARDRDSYSGEDSI